MIHYTLNVHGLPVLELDVHTWGAWFETADRQVAVTHVRGVRISTVFLGLDHAFHGPGPILFETLVFRKGATQDGLMRRYRTRAEAMHGHRAMVSQVGGRRRRPRLRGGCR